jgi:hypothetical protein
MGSLRMGKQPKPPVRLVRRSIDECEKIQRSIEALREHYAAVMIQRAFLRRAYAFEEYCVV